MWTFDQDKYMKQVLSPAVAEFTKSGELPDAFERYWLKTNVSYDLSDIQQAVKTVAAFWNKTKNNAKYEKLIKVLLEKDKETVQELTDEKARQELREVVKEEEKRKKGKRFADLDAHIKIGAGKGYLTPEERNRLITSFTVKGLTEQEIDSRINVPIQEEVKISKPDQGLDPTTRKKLRGYLAVLGKPNLYEFLEIRRGMSKEDLEKICQEAQAEWNKRKNDDKKVAANNLLAIVKTKLIAEGLEKYDKALVWDVIDNELNPQVEFAATDKKISREEFETLVSHGIKVGLTKEQTTEAIRWLAQEKGAHVELSEQAETVICAKCNTLVAKEKKKCTSCGEDLWTVCPKCAKVVALSETACGSCGFVTADRHRVNLLIRKAQLALQDKNLDEALKLARQAEVIWKARTDDVGFMLDKVEMQIKQAETHRQDYDAALAEKKLRAARDHLVMLIGVSPHFKGWDGKTPETLQRELELQTRKVEQLLEKARQFERENKVSEVIRVFREIQSLAVDFDEVQKGFKKYPPEPPKNVTATVFEGGVVIKWDESPATGSLEYLIVRCENRAPFTPTDGEVVARVPNNNFCDEKARPGSFVHYGVFTERGGAYSRCVVSDGVLAIKEVEDFSLEAGEAKVRGSWKFAVAGGNVRVLCGDEAALRKGEGREIQLSNPHSFTDENLINGQTYGYRVFVEYRDPQGKTVTTTGKFASATPAILPKEVKQLNMRAENGELQFEWTPPPFGTVSVYRLSQKPEWKCGTLISPASLASIGTPLRNKSEKVAVDTAIAKTRVYYTPFTIAGDMVVVGQTKGFMPAEEVSGLVVEDFESYLQLRWKWSGSFQSVVVAWRHDDYPNDARDSHAVRQKVTRGEYDAGGGFRIQNPKKKPYYIVVFTVTENDGKTEYSPGMTPDCQAKARDTSVAEINYSLKTKGWLWNKKFVLSLESKNPVASLPAVLVIAKPGETQPLDSESGKVVARIENAVLDPSLPFEYEFEMPKIKRPFFVRLFFAAQSSYNNYRLFDPPPKQLKIR